MMSPVEPFLSIELAARRERLMADHTRSRAVRAATPKPGLRAPATFVPKMVRAIAGH